MDNLDSRGNVGQEGQVSTKEENGELQTLLYSPFGFVSIDRPNPGPEFGCHSRVVKEGILPETEHQHVSFVSSSK